MGREIKFRAFVEKSRMIYSGDTYGDYLEFFEKCRYFHNGQGGCYLMQYTGLKDKNGKEIYEGDIIKSDYMGQSIGEVMYKPCLFGFLHSTPIGTNFTPIPIRNELYSFYLEVIGNVWEHPHLLEAK